MRLTRLTPLALLLGMIALAGCSKNSPTAARGTDPGAVPSMDQALVSTTIDAQSALTDDGLADSPLESTFDAGGGLTAIQPLAWWRNITSVKRDFEFTFSDPDTNGRPTTANVKITKLLTGTFNIRGLAEITGSNPPDSARLVVRKPLEDHWLRYVELKRTRLEGEDGEAIWRIVAASGVQVTAKNATTAIKSLRIQDGALDTTITDPLALQRLRRVLRFQPETMVTLTVTTGANDDAVYLHRGEGRFRLKNNGDNTYTGTFRAGIFMMGIHHFGVDALSHGTLFDDVAPYDSQRWFFPFTFEPMVLAESLP